MVKPPQIESVETDAHSDSAVERLTFRLPAFTRLSWVSDRARESWQKRLQQIVLAWSEMEWRSVLVGLRPCALVVVPLPKLSTREEAWKAAGLAYETLPECSLNSGSSQELQGATLYVVGSAPNTTSFLKHWQANRHDEIGALLAYPACCRSFFCQTCISSGWNDPTWAMAVHAEDPMHPQAVELNGLLLTNMLWRRIGIRAVPHLACRFDCGATQKLGNLLIDMGNFMGFGQEMEWLQSILSWPVEWTALHGIAELKTPILKVISNTDATGNKLRIRWKGHAYPPEGEHGTAFPYQRAERLHVVDSPSYQRGLSHNQELVHIKTAS